MSETPDIEVTQSSTYNEIHVTGQVSNLSYDGLSLTVLHDSPSLKKALGGEQFKVSKAIINMEIACTLSLSPINMKSWLLLFQQEVERYERMFGHTMSPEEVSEKFKEDSRPPSPS